MNRSLVFVAAVGLALPACKDRDDAADDAGKPAAAKAANDPDGTDDTQTAAAAPAEKLLEWLDPDAVAIIYSRLPDDLDPDALSVVFALPPKIGRMLRDAQGIEEGLDAILPPDAPRPDAWLGPESLAMASMVAAGTYVLRPLTKPRAEVQALLEKAQMHATETEGITIMVPSGPLPWKIAFVTDDVVAFIPAKEIGSGLGPLTAGRDLPPKEAERSLREVIRNEPDALLELYAAGPLLHFDMGQEVMQLMVQIRSWKTNGLDVQVRFQPSDDVQAAADTLEKREAPLESDQIQKLVERVAYAVEADTVLGRLQLTPDDVAVLEDAS